MRHRISRWTIAVGVLMALLILLSSGMQAQERGQYLPGFRGLNAAEQAPQGFTYANYFFWYPTTTFKDRNGNTVPVSFDIDLIADMNLFAYTTKAKFLGAKYGMAVGIPIVSTSVNLPRLNTGISPWGIGDIYVEPVNLSWNVKGTKVLAAYGFVAPTGRFDPTGQDTTTTDYFGHDLTFAVTHPLGKTKLWQVSASSLWEFHQKKRNEDVKVGNNVTLEYGVGKTFVKNQGQRLLQLGVVGYAEFQLSNDSGADVPLLSQGVKDRVFAMGPEFGVILPPKKFNFLVRVLPEFGARGRTQGLTLVFAIGKTFGGGSAP